MMQAGTIDSTATISATANGASESGSSAKLQQLKEVTGRVVGSVFYGEMLRAMRESKIRGAFGHGGRGEEVFSAQLHDMLAERMGSSGHGGLGEILYQKFEHQQSLVPETATSEGATP